jgi:signal transduction histidine kinase
VLYKMFDKIFQHFFKMRSACRGTELVLYLASDIIKTHGSKK